VNLLRDVDLRIILPLFQELLDHIAAATLSMVQYAGKYDLPLDDGLGFHLGRMESILHEMGHPLSHNPIESHIRRPVPVEPIRPAKDEQNPTDHPLSYQCMSRGDLG
jgi:hypothetical protein